MYQRIFDELSRRHTILTYERERLRAAQSHRVAAAQGDRGAAGQALAPTVDDYKLQAEINALNEALRGLAKLLEL